MKFDRLSTSSLILSTVYAILGILTYLWIRPDLVATLLMGCQVFIMFFITAQILLGPHDGRDASNGSTEEDRLAN